MTPRTQQIRRMTAAQAQHEKRVFRDVRKVFMSFSSDVAGKPDSLEDLEVEHRKDLEKALRRRLMFIALHFGSDTFETIKKSGAHFFDHRPDASPMPGQPIWPPEIKDAIAFFDGTISDWIRRHALERATTILETFRKSIANIIAGAFDEGLGEREVGRRIRERAPELSDSAAQRVARTETHSAANAGAYEAAKASGLDMVKEWGSAEDKRVRSSHADADGQETEMDEPFIVGEDELLFPGDPNGSAKEVINCRCIAFYHPRIDGEVFR